MIQIGVIGAGSCDEKVSKMAEAVGTGIAKKNATLICGGLGGVMEAASKGCKAAGGQTIGILPGKQKEDANQYIDHIIVTAMGHARNAIIAQSCDALIAVDGEYGTLSEIALSLKMGKPVVTLGSKWDIEGTWVAASPEDAVEIAMRLILTR
ncbi:TIGR00725 family protein [Methanococcoides cohabitans]|uniref:TIGR00725 family protein n=1 Tax=Methanococcoides cohabitans TaxID=3136559 RepID=UPI003AEF4D26